MIDIGSRIEDRYEVLSRIGKGTFCTVYSARDLKRQGTVALKVLNEQIRKQTLEATARFRREARILSRLRHRNVLRFFDMCVIDGTCVLVTELLDGQNLHDWTSTLQGLRGDVATFLPVLCQIVEGLKHTHDSGVLHRDIKPSNVMVMPDASAESGLETHEPAVAKIVDFGLARMVDFSRFAEQSALVGTFFYMAPEQAGLISQPVDQRADLYSLGILCYETLGGRLPYTGEEPGIILQQHLTRNPAPLVELNPAVPPSFSEIVERLMAKVPMDRYFSAGDLLMDLRALRESLRQGTTVFPLPSLQPARPGRLKTRVELVERAREKKELMNCFHETGQSRGRFIVLAGEAGGGKTRLVEELQEYVLAGRGLFLYGKCDEYTSKIPHQPFIEILEDLVEQFRTWPRQKQEAFRTDHGETLGHHGSVLVRLIPELRPLLGPSPALPELEPEGETERFLDSICQFFWGLAAPETPLVLVLDDLQWGQEETFHVLLRMTEHLARHPVLIIGACRQEEVRGNPHLQRSLKQIQQIPLVARVIRLKALSLEGVRTMVREAMGLSGGGYRSLYHAVHRLTRGNPFFVLETLKTMIENRILRKGPEGDRWGYDAEELQAEAVSTNLLDFIFRRFEQLSPDTRRVLSTASVLGRQFDYDLLFSVCGLEEDHLLDALDEAMHLHLIEEIRSGEQTLYQFFHDRIRQAVYEKMPTAEKQEVHQRIGLELEKVAVERSLDRDLFDLAHHFCNGTDAVKAFQYSVQAGDLAHRHHANREAVQHYREALKRLSGKDQEMFSHVQERLGDLHVSLGDYDKALEAYQCVRPVDQSPLSRARQERKLGTVFLRKAETTEARRHIENALTLLGRKPQKKKVLIFFSFTARFLSQLVPGWPFSLPGRKGPEQSVHQKRYIELYRCYRELGSLHYFQVNVRLWYVAFIHSVTYARKSRDPTLKAESFLDRAVVQCHFRNFRRARRLLRKSFRINSEQKDAWGLAKTKASMGCLSLYEGRLEEALGNIEEALPALEMAETPLELQGAYHHFVRACAATGDFQKVRRYLVKMEHLLTDRHDLVLRIAVRLANTTAYALMGEFDRSLEQLEIAKKTAEKFPSPLGRLACAGTAGFVMDVKDDWRAAYQTLNEVVEAIHKKRLYNFHSVAFVLSLVIACLKGASDESLDAEERRRILKKGARVLRRVKPHALGFRFYAGQWRILWGFYLGQQGKMRRTKKFFRTGTSILEGTGARYFLALWCAEISNFLGRQGVPAESHLYLNRAREIFKDLGLWREVTREGDEVRPGDAGTLLEPEEPVVQAEEPALLPESRELSSLLRASQLMSSSLELNHVLERIMDLSISSLGAERGFLMLYEEGERHVHGHRGRPGGRPSLQVLLARNMEEKTLEEEEFAFSRSIVREVETTGRPIVITDAQKDVRFKGSDSVVDRNLRSILCVPLQDREHLMGLLYVDNHLVSHLFTEGDLNFFQSLASFAVIAIRNARAYEEVQRHRDEIEKLKERLHDEVVYLTEEIQEEHNFEEMVGSGNAMQEVFRFIETAAPLDQTVLIQGETGTGKELVARAIHRLSPRGKKPMIKVNCAAIPEGLLESELFGHEKGAFTGAVQRKIGRFELASGGTLFLDEIGEMNPALQAKLLRVLENKEFERLGGTRTLKVQLCIIACTNRDLKAEVRKGNFREDLYYRLNVLPVWIPPLRERPEDIPLLLSHFITKFNKKYDSSVKDVDHASLETAKRYPWPGNVREVEHLVERAMVLSSSPCLKLAPMIAPGNEAGPAGTRTKTEDRSAAWVPEIEPGTLDQSVEAYKRRLVQEAIRRAGGSKKEAARALGMSPSSLSYLLKKLQIGS